MEVVHWKCPWYLTSIQAYFILDIMLWPLTINMHYYSFKIFPRFWLVKTKCIIHHNHLLLTRNFVTLNRWPQKCSPVQIIEPLTPKIIEPLTEKTWGRSCVIQQREKWLRVGLQSWAKKYFEWIIKQLLNSAFVEYEEFCRSRRVLSTSAFGLGG